MKLLYRVILRISLALSVILAVWAALFYVAVIDEVNDEMDDSLEDYSEAIITRSLAGKELPSENNGSNNQYYLTEVTAGYARSRNNICYADSMVYIREKQETEPARILTTIFEDKEGRFYELVVSAPTLDKADLREAILGWVVFLYLVLLVTILIICVFVFYRSMKPLYSLLHWLDTYRIGQTNEPLQNNTNITEFRKLNDATLRNAARNEHLFEQQKQFIGNASHEIQTPLAICRNRLEALMEDESLTESQLEELLKTHQTLERITRLNKSLLLLSKIDNRQFAETKDMTLNPILKQYLGDFKEVYAYKKLETQVEDKGAFIITMNESLAASLLTNLLKNAFLHNVDGGHIHIEISSTTITFRNSGTEALDKQRIFDRFYQGSKKEGSTGLGLAIVSSICKMQQLHITYWFETGEHCFRINKNKK